MYEIDKIYHGAAAQVLAGFPAGCIDLIITSPGYWQGDNGSSYGPYLESLQAVWMQCARVLRPNGKLCINSALMPVPQKIMPGPVRTILNIPGDIERTIISATDLRLFDIITWVKQTSKPMRGAYPHPGNNLMCNINEDIRVFVKPGKSPKFPRHVKAANERTFAEHMDLVQQNWFMYPQDVKRTGHPAPFPAKLPGRLIKLYTFGAAADFEGELVLDPFVGSGTTCIVAKQLGRRYIGIDVNWAYTELARKNLAAAPAEPPVLLVGRAKYPGKDELSVLAAAAGNSGNSGKDAEAQHEVARYGTRRTDAESLGH
jgi:DNA modification methylase